MTRNAQILRVKIALRDVDPPIWRRIEIPATGTFWDLHVAIQNAMGWEDAHLHAFQVRNPETGAVDEIGIPSEDEDLADPTVEILPDWVTPLRAYWTRPGDRAEYLYDFGDDWQHEITLEAIGSREGKTTYPRCLDGARACPPEDCGGPWGYMDTLARRADPKHPEYEETIRWLGEGFDPEAFDPRAVRFDSPKRRLQETMEGPIEFLAGLLDQALADVPGGNPAVLSLDLESLSEGDLLDLHRRVTERLDALARARTHGQIHRYAIGDRVVFTPTGRPPVTGVVVRHNKKTVGVAADDGHRWNVSPTLLSLIEVPAVTRGPLRLLPVGPTSPPESAPPRTRSRNRKGRRR